MCLLLWDLEDVLDDLNKGPSTTPPPIVDTTDTSGEITDTSQPRRRVRSKRTFKMKKSYATDELARFFVTSPTDASTKLSKFYCRTYLYSLMAFQRSYGIFKRSGISKAVNASALRLLDGVSLVLTASRWPKMSWRGSATKFCRLP